MQTVQWSATDSQYVISIDKSMISQNDFLEILRWIRLQFLVGKAQFDQEIEVMGEQILADWWAKNQSRFVPAEG